MCARGNRAYTCPRTIADPADCERQRRTPMTKILLATAVVALVAFATPASAQAVKNCSILHPAAAMVAEEVITWKLPSQTDGSAYTGPGDVFVWTTPERARIGGTANRVGHCWGHGRGRGDRGAVNHRLWVGV